MKSTRFGFYQRIRLALFFAGALVCVYTEATSAHGQGQDPSGFLALQSQLQAAGIPMPTGAGITVEQVEDQQLSGPGEYLPDPTDPTLVGKTFYDMTGGGQAGSHATNVAYFFYSSASFAPGINQIDVYEKTDWLTNVIGVDSSSAPALAPANSPQIINVSWKGTFSPNNSSDIDALRRFDYLIDRDHVLATVAVAYPGSPAVPSLMASAYNAIDVGNLSGNSSVGPTIYGDVPGRSKPDIVGPYGATSYNAPAVASAGALLMQVAASNAAYSAADADPTIIKAILMASANKDSVAHFNRTPSQPLDPVFGSGLLNVQRAYNLMTAGEQAASTTAVDSPTGWSVSSVGLGQTETYYLDVPADQAYDLSALVTWNRQIAYTAGTGGSAATFTPSMANIDLKLYRSDANCDLGTLIDSSTSSSDNVQDVFQRYLPAGRYGLQLTRADALATDPGNFGLAWQVIAAGQATWGAGASGSWSQAANWAPASVPNDPGVQVVLGPNAAPSQITLDGNQTVGSLTFNSAAGCSLSAGSLTLQNSASATAAITVLAGSASVGADIYFVSGLSINENPGTQLDLVGNVHGNGPLTLSGSGTLVLSGPANEISSASVSNASTLILTSVGALADGADLTVGSSAYFGTLFPADGFSPGSDTVSVPEPATLAIVAALTVFLFWRLPYASFTRPPLSAR